MIEYNLEYEMKENSLVIKYLGDQNIAYDFYRALCNMRWRKVGVLSEEEQIIDKLKGIESDYWSCTWRYAGSIIADIRNTHYLTDENYINYYCAGNEGIVTELVKECFEKMGWEPYPWKDDGL